ncbi:hydantoinase/oxoprolinase family protein [Burkholderia sp. Ac-20384]|uniref:hydantoinase/oxoprolinase family protein n=1 Tax=Burkholderia sp. Ac-20384 TaxID=2703902 RepID=UPI001981C0A3|nr:hydantoinase/oxoprolinase family protein [Burkholderia sp. Ac-20384]MBN3822838.1 hydantoinase/oxoprolinase family protein [Burkholderia sp. Ac-20384]
MTIPTDSIQHAASGTSGTRTARHRLINIDNGGTLTDICVMDGDNVIRTKTLTTPHDLSQCLFDGLRKASVAIYGNEDLEALLLSTAAIRYSTTQGTNALVERKGPRLGLVVGGTLSAAQVREADGAADLFDAVIGSRAVTLSGDSAEADVVRAVGELAASGANRLVVAIGGPQRVELEQRLKRKLLRSFPPHLLGALPILYAHEIADDASDVRRTWTALFNAFLHPAMERFLYSAEQKLRDARAQSPLLVFRNDGYAGRVAKTIALKTYSSGPRGGMEGARVLARHYGLTHLLSMDIGGTTTDIGVVDERGVRAERHGNVEGVATSFALCDVVSAGVGGSSIIRVAGERIAVGPESVGSAPGPACFGLGGTQATITDAFTLSGLLDPASFFGGKLQLDKARARQAVHAHVADPLKMGDLEALAAMEAAWVKKVADSLTAYASIRPDTTLAAFGGAGALVACRVAEAIGVKRVLIPGLAAVFSAYGISFSDVGHSFSAPLAEATDSALAAAMDTLFTQASRAMFGEDAAIDDCRLAYTVEATGADGRSSEHAVTGTTLPAGLAPDATLSVSLTAIKRMPQATLDGRFDETGHQPAVAHGTRRVVVDGRETELPLYRVEDQPKGVAVRAAGPAVLEEAFFTGRIDAGWHFDINSAGDILLSSGTENE